MEKHEFLLMAIAAAKESSAISGMPPGITVAQAALESAWGQSGLSRLANNYFGIKLHGKYESIELPTTEVVNGATVRSMARFAKYASMKECFADRDRIVLNGARYAEARRWLAEPEQFARELAKHWATDPGYAEKLLSLYRQNGLEALDKS